MREGGWLPSGAVFDCLIWGPGHSDALIPSVALECMTVERLMLALVVAAAAVPRSAAGISWNICRGMATSAI